jgi:dethiobiotin synthetase/malonyl-CoA O-methyltransferase
MRGLFITGTDTNVGKTVVAAALLHRYRQHVVLRYWKPIQTGTEQSDDTRDVRHLGMCGESEILDTGIRLTHSLSPHLAARLSRTAIELPCLVEIAAACAASGGREASWLVEGAGGALVPINETEFMTDLMKQLSLPILVVGRSGLGTINHTLMTLEALRQRGLPVAGVVMVGEKNSANREAIETFGHVKVIGELPVISPLAPEKLGAWARAELDPYGLLMECFE